MSEEGRDDKMNDLSITFDMMQPFDTRLSNGYVYLLVDHNVGGNTYETCAIHIDDLARCFNDAIDGIKNAAYHTSSDFALSSHDHDIYTSATYVTNITGENAKQVMKMSDLTHNVEYSVAVSSVVGGSIIPDTKKQELHDILTAYLPKLGTMQMVSAKDLTQYKDFFSYDKPQFMGWIYADGATYQLTSFELSDSFSNVFSIDGSKFSVPCLSNICKIDCNVDDSTTGSYGTVHGQAALPSHSHQVVAAASSGSPQLTLDASQINIEERYLSAMFSSILGGQDGNPGFTPWFRLRSNESTGYKWTLQQYQSGDRFRSIHYGMATANTTMIELANTEYVQDFIVNGLEIVNADGIANDVPYPSHTMMPVVVYVGPSIYSDLVGTYVKSE